MEVELRRIERFMLLLAAAGSLAALWRWGAATAAGFLLGAVASYFNFRWFKRLVNGMGASDWHLSPQARFFLVFRYVLFGAVGYVIVRFFGIRPVVPVIGFLVASTAVILEILYELIYAGT